jgi:ParB family chromosome partitioning protein
MNRPSGLGRGLAALIPTAATASDDAVTVLHELPVDDIGRNPRQPREVFDEEELANLAASIESLGLLQPLVVRRTDDGFQLVAGERRLRAARLAGLATVPAIVRTTDDTNLLTEALVENVQRVQLNPIEEASAYAQLLDDFGVSQEELAKRLGKSRPTISNLLRLLTLSVDIQRRVAAGVLTAGHAKALLSVPTEDGQARLADRIVGEQLWVRPAVELAGLEAADHERTPPTDKQPRHREPPPTLELPGVTELEETLSEALNAAVSIRVGRRSGRVTIGFSSADELDRLVDVISRGLARSDGSG